MLVKICLQILDFEKKKKKNRLNVQAIISSVTLCEKQTKQKKKQQKSRILHNL